MKDLIKKIDQAGLRGRGGAGFPTAAKWQAVLDAPGERKFVVCNASEGEPGPKKDFHILKNYPERVIDGMMLALKTIGAERAYIYINPEYHRDLAVRLEPLLKNLPIILFKKAPQAGYIGGEESSAINHIEGRRIEPRLRPPFPVTHGLWGFPTLVNNVETFWAVSRIASGEYGRTRFITIGGDCLYPGVYELDEGDSVEKMLKESGNYPDYDFFVQVGGNYSGEVLNSVQLDRELSGSGSITVYSYLKHSPEELMKDWAKFFADQSCGQCTPCREGSYRLLEMLRSPDPNWKLFSEILDTLDATSLCGLGCSISVPFRSYVHNVLKHLPDNTVYIEAGDRKTLCECLE